MDLDLENGKTIPIVIGIITAALVLGAILVIVSIPTFLVGDMLNPSSLSQRSYSDNFITKTTATTSANITTVNSAKVYQTSWYDFKTNGQNQFITSSLKNNNIADSFTLSFWAKSAGAQQNTSARIIGMFENGCYWKSGSIIYCFVRNLTGGTYPEISTTGLSNNTWYHVAFIYDDVNTNISMFIDGVFRSNLSLVWRNATPNYFTYIGKDIHNGGEYFNGSVDEVRIYNSTLTQAQIITINNSGRVANNSLLSTGLMAWYKLNENNDTTGTEIYDSRGTYNATLTLATSNNGGTQTTLTPTTDYTTASNIFTLANHKYDYDRITLDYVNNYGTEATNQVTHGFASGLNKIIYFIGSLIALVMITLIIIFLSFVITKVREYG